MYVYICPNAQAAAQTHIVNERIEALRQRIEADPPLFSLLFSSRFPCWVRRMKNLRLVADLRFLGQERVLCFADILLRGSAEYRVFLKNPGEWGQQNININGLEAWLEQRKQAPPTIQRSIPDRLYGWLERPTLMQWEDRVIYESQVWVEYFRSSTTSVSQHLLSFYSIVAQLVGAETLSYTVENTRFSNVELCTAPTGCCVLFSRICPLDAPQRQILFLLAAFDRRPTQVEIAQIGNQLRLFGWQATGEPLSNPITANDIARYACRAYPDLIVSYFENWRVMESEQNINLALSGEEEKLLSEMNFPTFINGRAGSGKSTMLHYAFAYYCELYLKNIDRQFTDSSFQPASPLFLTYSDRLSEKAYDVVQRILSSHAYYISRNTLTPAQLDLLSECFQPFQSFLLSSLPADVVNSSFDRSKYVSFHEFKKRYARSFPNPTYDAEICWHAIRTYIKGYHFVDEHQYYLSVEEYRDEIPANHKTISDDDFREIYNTIWQWYRNNCQNKQLWDDQDLARTILREIANGKIKFASHAAIFCDEAQDFTRIEFQIILRLSVWSEYLLPNPVNSLPFAFAGDPLQTLNPTGFNWTSFLANFYENVLIPLDPDNSRGLQNSDKVTLHQLQQNYRSPAHVVKFTNFIHLWRRVLFDIRNLELEPQEPWWIQNGSPPQKGVLNIDLVVADLRELVNSGAIFLLPCDEGGELEFLRRSQVLKQVFPSVEKGQIPPTVYTPIGLKGLELSHIVVCFFGEYYGEDFGEICLQSLTNTNNNLQLEYFLNKLYVAVSRSTDYLAIVDTQRGDRLLWQAATQSELSSWLNRMSLTLLQAEQGKLYKKKWTEKISFLTRPLIIPGTGQVDFQANARQWLLRGIENQNIHNLETAIYYYEKAGTPIQVSYCKAWILRFEGNLLQAGRAFMELGNFADLELPSPQEASWQCFWKGQAWRDLSEWVLRYSDSPKVGLEPVFKFMLNTTGRAYLPEQINSFSTFLNTPNQDRQLRPDRKDPVWNAVIERYRQIITKFVKTTQTLAAENWLLWGETLRAIAQAGFTPRDTIILAGRCLYRAESFQQASEIWEKQQYTNHHEYFIAKGEISPPPQNVQWFNRAKIFDRIVQIWQKNECQIDGNWQSELPSVRQALRETNQFAQLLELEIKTKQWLAAIKLCNQQNFNNTAHINIVSRMARDARLTPDAVPNLQYRQLLSEFVHQTIVLPGWKLTEVKILEACVAIERTGDFRTVLRMLERFTEDRFTGDIKIPERARKFARERWLVVKGKQAEFAQNEGRREEANRQRQERDRKAEEWDINVKYLSANIPSL